MKRITRRELVSTAMGGTESARTQSTASKNRPSKLADVGWSWEGQGLTGGAGLSIFGVGEGAEYWGLRKVVYMFQPLSTLAMDKLRQFEEVVCEITPAARPIHCGVNCIQMDGLSAYGQRVEDLFQDAEMTGRLSLTYRNITGGYIDDSLGRSDRKPNAFTPELYTSVHHKLTGANPSLKLWALAWTKQLYEEEWAGFKPYMDVINLWVPWSTSDKDLAELDRHIAKCREVFPGKPLVLGCFLYQFSPQMRALPLELVKVQWERILKYVRDGQIEGYSILAAFLIDGAQEQARWIRDLIAAN
ncbi:MAG TPA: hypothetical protein VGK99_24245 [Acidobacteriota bacterium]|jgi:hypothetical protein